MIDTSAAAAGAILILLAMLPGMALGVLAAHVVAIRRRRVSWWTGLATLILVGLEGLILANPCAARSPSWRSPCWGRSWWRRSTWRSSWRSS